MTRDPGKKPNLNDPWWLSDYPAATRPTTHEPEAPATVTGASVTTATVTAAAVTAATVTAPPPLPEGATRTVPPPLPADRYDDEMGWEDMDLQEWLAMAETPMFDTGDRLSAELGQAEVVLLSPERRRDDRVTFSRDVRVRHGACEESAQMLNISTSGMVIRANCSGRPGADIHIDVETIDGPLHLRGEVRWIRLLEKDAQHTFEVGLRLIMPPERWHRLYESVRWEARGRRTA